MDIQWNIKFDRVVQFKREFGHLNVPAKDPAYHSMYTWLTKQRASWRQFLQQGNGGGQQQEQEQPKKRMISLHQIQRLVDLGFGTSIYQGPINFAQDNHATSWEEQFQTLLQFQKEYGHLNVCESTHKGTRWYQLAQWCRSQRKNYINRQYLAETGKKRPNGTTILTDYQMTKLTSVNFRLQTTKQPDFDHRIQQLVQYKSVHGHMNVPRSYKHDNNLGRWVGKIKSERSNFKLDEERLAKLDAIGFDWTTTSLLLRHDHQNHHHQHDGHQQHNCNNDDDDNEDDDDYCAE